MADQNDKPNPLYRDKVINEDITILSSDRIERLSRRELQNAKEYYSAVLEVLCGKQVWKILKALNEVENRLK